MTTAERQQLLRQAGGALGGAPDLGGRMLPIRPGRHLFDQLVAVAQQDGDQVVEVVGDAGGEAADGLHLLRLAQLVLQPVALAQVARNRGDTNDLAVADQHLGMHIDGNSRALARHQFRAKRPGRAVGTFLEHAGNGVEIVRAEGPVRVEHPQLLARIAGGLFAGAVERGHPAATVVDDHDLARPLEHVVEARLERRLACQLAANRPFLDPPGAVGDAGGAGRRQRQHQADPCPPRRPRSQGTGRTGSQDDDIVGIAQQQPERARRAVAVDEHRANAGELHARTAVQALRQRPDAVHQDVGIEDHRVLLEHQRELQLPRFSARISGFDLD